MDQLLLRVPEVARMLGISRTRTYELVAGGDLPVVKIGRSVRVPRKALEEWVRDRAAAGDEGRA